MIQITKHFEDIKCQNEISSGFQMTFENGNTISVQFGFGNYCNNKFKSLESCIDAEIAIWNKDDIWYQFENTDSVKGYCNSNEVAKWIEFAANNKF
jgi:hypothetical protein